MPESKTFRVLHVEDDDDHHELFRLAFEAGSAPVLIERACDGASALAYFSGSSCISTAGVPDLIILDLNIPAPNGYEVLSFLKNDPRLRQIPVVILTTSSNEEDVRRAMAERANAFITKPSSASAFDRLAADLRGFWVEWNARNPDRDITLRN